MSERNPDYLVILEEVLLAARQNGIEAGFGAGETDRGRAFAYHDVLSVAIEQAQLLGVPLSDIGLADFDPDREVLHVNVKQRAA